MGRPRGPAPLSLGLGSWASLCVCAEGAGASEMRLGGLVLMCGRGLDFLPVPVAPWPCARPSRSRPLRLPAAAGSCPAGPSLGLACGTRNGAVGPLPSLPRSCLCSPATSEASRPLPLRGSHPSSFSVFRKLLGTDLAVVNAAPRPTAGEVPVPGWRQCGQDGQREAATGAGKPWDCPEAGAQAGHIRVPTPSQVTQCSGGRGSLGLGGAWALGAVEASREGAPGNWVTARALEAMDTRRLLSGTQGSTPLNRNHSAQDAPSPPVRSCTSFARHWVYPDAGMAHGRVPPPPPAPALRLLQLHGSWGSGLWDEGHHVGHTGTALAGQVGGSGEGGCQRHPVRLPGAVDPARVRRGQLGRAKRP